MYDLLTSEHLNDLLRYDPDSGFLYWRARTPEMFEAGKRSAEWRCNNWNALYAGKPALNCLTAGGYYHGKIHGKLYYAHRVIWCMIVGAWPEDHIDHENGDPEDNRFENLRDVTQAENQRNQKTHSTNTSGHLGVSWHKQRQKWNAKIQIDGRNKSLGLFDTLDAAIAARAIAEREHGFHENHGR